MSDAPKQLLFCSWYAFDPAIWAVLEKLVREHRFSATVCAPPSVRVDQVYSPSGYLTPDLVDHSFVDLRLLPPIEDETPLNGFDPEALRSVLADLKPDAIWIHGEPTDGLTRQIVKHFYFHRRVTIACFLAENLWQRSPWPQRIKARILCHRIDALLACGSASSQSAYQMFMPRSVKSHTIFMPNFDPKTSDMGLFQISRKPGEFWVGFVGKICEEKGWRVLLNALTQLPPLIKAVIAGSGPQLAALKRQISLSSLTGRVIVAGPLAPPDTRALLSQVDAVAVPSLTTPRWMEQFGRVIAESMAAGKPVVASRSGAIPEVVGEAGLLVQENDSVALANALRRLVEDAALRDQLGNRSRLRFEQEFSVDVYARRLAKLLNG